MIKGELFFNPYFMTPRKSGEMPSPEEQAEISKERIYHDDLLLNDGEYKSQYHVDEHGNAVLRPTPKQIESMRKFDSWKEKPREYGKTFYKELEGVQDFMDINISMDKQEDRISGINVAESNLYSKELSVSLFTDTEQDGKIKNYQVFMSGNDEYAFFCASNFKFYVLEF